VNILIVDDHPTNLKLLRAQLEAEGMVVFEATDGVQALAARRDQLPAGFSDRH
jgi:CheY-like chemotaxis protein